jgi:putative oxidoreductase
MTAPMSLGLLVLRVVIGLLFVGHGTQKLFGWFGGHGLEGTGGFMASLGYRPGKQHALLAGLAEAGGGALFALGALTPLAVAAIVGVMVNAIGSAHWDNGLWVTNGGYEYPLVLCAAAAAVAFVGPGSYSVDRLLQRLDGTWHVWGLGWGLVGVAVGLCSGMLLLATRERPPTVAAEPAPADAEPRRAA